MQRIRYGLTGLAFVFLMVLLGTAIVRSGDEPQANAGASNEAPSDPLADLGVAPGQGSENEADKPANSAR
ncbi:hypothetical protein GCM10022281_04030 [Sphingomonas rosea]|jgi:hypothetical protein|uniref:Uncharacterized protein n=2 Tax=Sphingomonas rosea TaxID=335605 RepID=A0ABP7TP24_9SPHN